MKLSRHSRILKSPYAYGASFLLDIFGSPNLKLTCARCSNEAISEDFRAVGRDFEKVLSEEPSG